MRVGHVLTVPGLLVAVIGTGIATASTASADCVSSAGTTVCSQGSVRGSDTGEGPGTGPAVPYPCEYDWYCGGGVEINLGPLLPRNRN